MPGHKSCSTSFPIASTSFLTAKITIVSYDAGTMSDKSVTELVGNFRRPILGGDGHVWLATRGPGEFVGECQSSNINLYTYTLMML